MKALYLYTKYNHPKPYPIRFAYLIVGEEIDLLEFEMQKKVDIIKDVSGNLVYLFTHFLGKTVDIKLNKNTNTHYMDGMDLYSDEIMHKRRYKSNFWVSQYELTGDRNWILNRLIFEPGTTKLLNEKNKVPMKLKRELLTIHYG